MQTAHRSRNGLMLPDFLGTRKYGEKMPNHASKGMRSLVR